jgi:hypothetical protein
VGSLRRDHVTLNIWVNLFEGDEMIELVVVVVVVGGDGDGDDDFDFDFDYD